jgi:hypothetical protein
MRSLRRYVPGRLTKKIRTSRLLVRHHSAAQNVYFACVQKTASRWLRRILKDERVFRACGLQFFDYIATLPASELRSLTDIRFPDEFPPRTIVGPLYTAYEGYLSIPKPDDYRTFFVMRDPRDIVVSWYYSMRYSHASMEGRFNQIRADLGSLAEREGLKRASDLLAGPAQLFPALRSWIDAPTREERVALVRYGDLTGPHAAEAFGKLFEHCDIRLTEKTLTELLADHSFERMSGRHQGQEDVKSHYRKGKAGDWEEHLDDELIRHFREVTGDLLEALGYE